MSALRQSSCLAGSAQSSAPTRSFLRFVGSSSRIIKTPKRMITANSNDEDSTEPTVDWNAAWRDFQNKLPEVEARTSTTTEPPRFERRKAEWNSGSREREDIRKQENFLLDSWTTETFFKFGGGFVVVLIIALLFVAGPPPTDARCTLPWC